MATLKTNYKDDVLDTSKNTKRKYNMINNPDGTVSLEDVTSYTQVGDKFGAGDINGTNTEINALNTSLTQKISSKNGTYSEGTFVKLDSIAFDEANGKLLLTKAGADTPIPFSGDYTAQYASKNSSITLDHDAKFAIMVTNVDASYGRQCYVSVNGTRIGAGSNIFSYNAVSGYG